MSRWAAGALVLACGAFGPSCGRELTEIVVVVDTDLCAPSPLYEVVFEVQGTSGPVERRWVDLARLAPPLTLGLVLTSDVLGPIAITVTGNSTIGSIERRARVSFVRGQTRMLRLNLLRSCAGSGCGAGLTCAEAGCRGLYVEPSELEPWTGSPQSTVLPESLCDDGGDNDCDGAIDCGDSDCEGQSCSAMGYACTSGSCVCPTATAETNCLDGVDDDCDTWVDCADPECDGQPCDLAGSMCAGTACRCPGGSVETNCANGIDDDCDSLPDCADADCTAAADCCAFCSCPDVTLPSSAPLTELGSTFGAGGERAGTCGGGPEPDVTYAWAAPAAATYSFVVSSPDFTPVVYVLDGCGGGELGCSVGAAGADALVTATLAQDQPIVIVVDGAMGTSGSYTLSIVVP